MSAGTTTGLNKRTIGTVAERVGDLADRPDENSEATKVILDAIRATKFGEVTIIVQDGLVVQVNRLEKKRLR